MNFLWGNPHEFNTEEYKKYESLRTSRNRMMFISWLNFTSCFREYGKEPFKWVPVWANYVFMITTAISIFMLFWYKYKMVKVGTDKKRLEFVETVLEE